MKTPPGLEHALREGGEKVTEGRIRVDSARALQRLRDFRFAEPAHWVLEVLRAAALGGARTVTVRTDADDVELAFDGQPLPAALMEHLLEQALNEDKTPDQKRARLLALGVAGALGMGAVFVRVSSGGVALSLRGDSVEVTKAASSRLTTVHLRKAFGWRVTTNWLRGAPEAAAVAARAHRFPGTVELNGKNVVRLEAFGTSSVERRSASGEGWSLSVSLPTGGPRTETTLDVDVAGVLVTTRRLELPALQLEAWLRADGVRLNASGSDVVDSDAVFQQALRALKQLSGELLSAVPKLVREPSWRGHFQRAIARDPKGPLFKRLREVPFLPGPAGELVSLDALNEAARQHRCLYFATREHPRGSYPQGTVLAEALVDLDAVLPKVPREDVARLVERRAAAATHRAEHARLPVEEPVLPKEPRWVARAPIDGKDGHRGEAGFARDGAGAFVRVLHQGRQLALGELTALAPLRLQAVVDWVQPLSDAYFEPDGTKKALELVRPLIERAARQALAAALPADGVLPHVLDLVTNHVVVQRRPVSELPDPVRSAPLFPCFEAPSVSLTTLLSKGEPWRYVERTPEFGLLSGARLLVLTSSRHLEVLMALNERRLESAAPQLDVEREVRKRLAAAKRAPVLDDVLAKVPFSGPNFRGEVGIPRKPTARLTVTFLKDGLELETTELSPRYDHAVAFVESADFSPNERWTAVTRDDVVRAVVDALFEAQRALVVPLIETDRARWAPGTERVLAAMLKRELPRFEPKQLDPVQAALVRAPLFDGARGRRSLLQLHEQLGAEGTLYVAPARPRRVPQRFDGVFDSPVLAEALGVAFGRPPADGARALEAAAAREALEANERVPLELAPVVKLQASGSFGGVRFIAGLIDGTGEEALVRVTIDGYRYAATRAPSPLPLDVILDEPGREPLLPARLDALPDGWSAWVLHAILTRATDAKAGDLAADRAVCLALGRGVLRDDTTTVGKRLLTRDVFPCTDGRRRAASDFEVAPSFTVDHEQGSLPDGRPIVVAKDPFVRVALGRWPEAQQVDEALATHARARRERADLAAWAEITASSGSPKRFRIRTGGLDGELVLEELGGRLELFFERKPLCVLEGVLPPTVSAAVDVEHLTLTPDLRGVVRDRAFDAALVSLRGAVERFAAWLAQGPIAPADAPRLARLACWVAARTQDVWGRGLARPEKRKKKGKKQPDASPAAAPPVTLHPLLSAPLFRANDGTPLGLDALITAHRAGQKAEYTLEGGRFLQPGRRCWWPRSTAELDEVKTLDLALRDVTDAITRDEAIRQRPKQDALGFYADSPWREPVQGPGLRGTVTLHYALDRKLTIEVLKDGVPLELYTTGHEVGGLARVDAELVTPNEGWTEAKRDAHFKAVVVATEAALERLVARRIAVMGPDVLPWVQAALEWEPGNGGPLSRVLPTLPLFQDLTGKAVTLGAVLELARQRGRVPLSSSQPQGGVDTSTVVLRDSTALRTRPLLETLGVKWEDVTHELRRAKNVQQSVTRRRLASLTVGDALFRRKVATPELTGELALSLDLDAPGKVTLAREGIGVGALEASWAGVLGVLDVKDLAVNGDWTKALPTRAQRERIAEQVDALFDGLAAEALRFGADDLERATTWALRRLSSLGVSSATSVLTAAGPAKALVDAPFFLTLRGERIGLRALAAEVSSRGRVAVLRAGVMTSHGAATCVLAARALDLPWLDALQAVLGGATKVWRVKAVSEWEQEAREADPPPGTPALGGLVALRRHVRLLRAGALGTLTPDDLEDVRLSRDDGSALGLGRRKALRYDARRKLVLLDPDDSGIARALAEADTRPDRLFALAAAVFGLVNRELDRVTDDHEAQLLVALAAHLAANPHLLNPKDRG